MATLALTGAACGDDEDTAETGSEATTTTTGEDTTAAAEGEVVAVTAVDYAFEGLPSTLEAGTRLSLTNATENNEVHELVAIRIPDEETRSVAELVQLPEEEIDAIFGSSEPATVILAAPGQTDVPGPVVGDGTLSEPGRYAVVCFIPVGADPAVVLDPNAEGPPESDAPPHAAQGMVAEVTVS
jgi:plastocyanin